MESRTTDHSPFCGEDYEQIQIQIQNQIQILIQIPEGKDSLKKKKMNTCNERKQPEKVTVKSANKDHSKNKISKAKGTTLSKHTIKINITVEKGLKVGRKR